MSGEKNTAQKIQDELMRRLLEDIAQEKAKPAAKAEAPKARCRLCGGEMAGDGVCAGCGWSDGRGMKPVTESPREAFRRRNRDRLTASRQCRRIALMGSQSEREALYKCIAAGLAENGCCDPVFTCLAAGGLDCDFEIDGAKYTIFPDAARGEVYDALILAVNAAEDIDAEGIRARLGRLVSADLLEVFISSPSRSRAEEVRESLSTVLSTVPYDGLLRVDALEKTDFASIAAFHSADPAQAGVDAGDEAFSIILGIDALLCANGWAYELFGGEANILIAGSSSFSDPAANLFAAIGRAVGEKISHFSAEDAADFLEKHELDCSGDIWVSRISFIRNECCFNIYAMSGHVSPDRYGDFDELLRKFGINGLIIAPGAVLGSGWVRDTYGFLYRMLGRGSGIFRKSALVLDSSRGCDSPQAIDQLTRETFAAGGTHYGGDSLFRYSPGDVFRGEGQEQIFRILDYFVDGSH